MQKKIEVQAVASAAKKACTFENQTDRTRSCEQNSRQVKNTILGMTKTLNKMEGSMLNNTCIIRQGSKSTMRNSRSQSSKMHQDIMMARQMDRYS